MVLLLAVVLLLASALVVPAVGAGAALSDTASPAVPGIGLASFRDGVVLVGFAAGLSPAQQAAAVHAADSGARESRTVARTHVLSVPPGRVAGVIARLRRNPAVRFAEPDFLGTLAGTPNDPSFGQQWPLQNTGQSVSGTAGASGADERASSAWSVTTGSASIVVGEVDTGVDYTHPDLANAVWSNPGGVNGCPAGSRGFNAITGACDAMDDDTTYNGHGTHVAGIIGATGNNGIGVTGVNWSTTILPVKTVSSSGVGATSDLITGLDWIVRAKQAGVDVRVVNDSQTWRGTAYSQALVDEIDALGRNGILFVSAGGNTSDDNDDPALRRYPCGYDRSNSICAAATTQTDGLASYANRGSTTVDLGAPGDNVYSTLRGGGYGVISGSSMAAAEVSGSAALALAARPTLDVLDLKAALLEGADADPALAGLVRTGARLDTCAAVGGCQPAGTGSTTAGTTTIGGSSDTMSADRKRANRVTLSAAGSIASLSMYLQPGRSGSQTLTGFVYADAGGTPGALLGTTSADTYSASSGARWFSLAFATPVAVQAGSYWIGVLSGTTSNVTGFRYTSVPGSRAANSNPASAGPSNPFGSAKYDAEQMSLYATWTPTTPLTPPPFPITPPGVTATGTSAPAPTQGQVVTATTGDWTGSPTSTAFSWQRCSSTGHSCTPISGATASSYLPTAADVGATLQAVVTATGAGGPASSASPPSMAVAAGTSPSPSPSMTASPTPSPTQTPTATPTPSSSPSTFGVTTVGPNGDTMLADRKRVDAVSLPAAGSVTSLSMYLAPTATSGSQSLTGVLYADASGAPGALLGTTQAMTYTSQSAAGWYVMTFPSAVPLTVGRYWIGVLSSGTSGVTGFRWTSSPSARAYNADTAADGPSNPFGAAGFDSEQMSVYATCQ